MKLKTVKKIINGKIRYESDKEQTKNEQLKTDNTFVQKFIITPLPILQAKTKLYLETKYNNNKNKTKWK